MTADDLRRWRHRHGYTQAQAAEALGISIATVRAYEQGHRSINATVERLCACLDREKETPR